MHHSLVLITANTDQATKDADRRIAFEQGKSVRQWAGEVIAKAVKAATKPK